MIFSRAMCHVTCSRDINKSLPAQRAFNYIHDIINSSNISSSNNSSINITHDVHSDDDHGRRLRYAPRWVFFFFMLFFSYFHFY